MHDMFVVLAGTKHSLWELGMVDSIGKILCLETHALQSEGRPCRPVRHHFQTAASHYFSALTSMGLIFGTILAVKSKVAVGRVDL